MQRASNTKGRPKPLNRRPATTTEVLGNQSAQPKIPSKWKKHYDRLADLHEQLLRNKNDLAEDARQETPTLGTHLADAGTDTFDRDWALSMLSSEQDAVYEIEEAMNRIRLGTYGKCELTGKPIEPGRLNAIPWTRFTAEAERELEKNGLDKRAHLGELGSFRDVSRSAEKEADEP